MSTVLRQFVPLNMTVVDIGDWDMDTNESVSVPHGLSVGDIRSVTGMIREDDDAGTDQYAVPGGFGDLYINLIGSTDIELKRAASSIFDSTGFDKTSFNRGWLVIWHT